MSEVAAKSRRQRARCAAKQVGEFAREIGEVFGVKRSDVGEEHGPVAEVLGDGGVAADAGDGGEVHSGLSLKEFEGGIELVINKKKLRFVAFGIALHFRLK